MPPRCELAYMSNIRPPFPRGPGLYANTNLVQRHTPCFYGVAFSLSQGLERQGGDKVQFPARGGAILPVSRACVVLIACTGVLSIFYTLPRPSLLVPLLGSVVNSDAAFSY
eukprot:365767-Chlamydomonas_euryale.AAC.10